MYTKWPALAELCILRIVLKVMMISAKGVRLMAYLQCTGARADRCQRMLMLCVYCVCVRVRVRSRPSTYSARLETTSTIRPYETSSYRTPSLCSTNLPTFEWVEHLHWVSTSFTLMRASLDYKTVAVSQRCQQSSICVCSDAPQSLNVCSDIRTAELTAHSHVHWKLSMFHSPFPSINTSFFFWFVR